ncbi:hypothetical protein [Maledivibacter halophilus]|uniref:Uncharacterized protein n=1 Tax=Maledivibacter halophilus TaxID=36842 RepID=A0A1T5IVC7_9FIRM|nr:hypothetical protein [Maledivibacter halophilus]SKC43105.1 hypothetical protein SAMN02194393_00784 [Maledivibacter halophilus]
MREELVDIVEDFIKLCDKLLESGKIDNKMYDELTQKKVEFLKDTKRVI